jgi:hypothetical protein
MARVSSYPGQSCGICGAHRVTGTPLFVSTSISPETIIPPMRHTHPFFHNRRYTILADNVFKQDAYRDTSSSRSYEGLLIWVSTDAE